MVLAISRGTQDPSSLTRNQTSGLQWQHGVSTIGPPGKSHTFLGFDDSDCFEGASLVAQSAKNPSANPGDTRDAASIPGSGRSPGEGNGNSGIYRISFNVGLSAVFLIITLVLQKLERKTTEGKCHSHRQGAHFRLKLSQLMLALVTWLSSSLPGFSTVKSLPAPFQTVPFRRKSHSRSAELCSLLLEGGGS